MKIEALSLWAKYKDSVVKIDGEPSRTDMGILTNKMMAEKICTDSRGKVGQAIKDIAREGDLMSAVHEGYSIAKLSALKGKAEYENKLTLQWIRPPTINIMPGELKIELKPFGQIIDKRI